MQVVYEFPECTLTYSMRKGNGLKFNGHDYGILFCGTDGSLLLDRGGFEVIPDKVVLPTGSSSSTAIGRSARSTSSPRRPRASTARPRTSRNFLECVKSRPCRPATSRSPTAPPTPATWATSPTSSGRKLEWDADTETFKNDSEANAHSQARAAQGLRAAQV